MDCNSTFLRSKLVAATQTITGKALSWTNISEFWKNWYCISFWGSTDGAITLVQVCCNRIWGRLWSDPILTMFSNALTVAKMMGFICGHSGCRLVTKAVSWMTWDYSYWLFIPVTFECLLSWFSYTMLCQHYVLLVLPSLHNIFIVTNT